MRIWQHWSTAKKTKTIVGALLLVGVLLYGLFMDLTGRLAQWDGAARV